VDLDTFHPGDPSAARARFGLPRDAVVVGHLGRLAPEKNLEFLARAVARAMRRDPRMRFLVAGAGPSLPAVRRELAAPALRRRLHAPGPLSGPALVAAYQAMDVFAFASHSETQGMVLAEAMACGVPVVAVDADGVREVVLDGVNGRSIARDDTASFADALCEIAALSPHDVARLSAGALATAARMSITRCADEALALYATLVGRGAARRAGPDSLWAASMRRIRREVQILSNMAGAASDALLAP
jgi:1,2-diacylglycerol 3-alpha-glucosyltransferase